MAIVLDGSTGVTMPAGGLANTAGAAVGTTDSQTLTNKTIQGGALTLATAVASTSGTSIDFTGIPSWVKRVTVMFSGVSTSGTSAFLFQLGDAGGIETTGYESLGVLLQTATPSSAGSTSGIVTTTSLAAASAYQGAATFSLLTGNTWVCTGQIVRASTQLLTFAGNKTLSDTLTQVRITTVNGTDTFDAGIINIMYEG